MLTVSDLCNNMMAENTTGTKNTLKGTTTLERVRCENTDSDLPPKPVEPVTILY